MTLLLDPRGQKPEKKEKSRYETRMMRENNSFFNSPTVPGFVPRSWGLRQLDLVMVTGAGPNVIDWRPGIG